MKFPDVFPTDKDVYGQEPIFKHNYMKNPKSITTTGPDNFWEFNVPTFLVDNDGLQDGGGATIKLCRGDKADESKPRQEGMFTETLLQVCKQYLEGVNVGPLASRENSMAITKIDEALLWIGKRAEDRKLREVQGTYQK
jgi:hypothetical protein